MALHGVVTYRRARHPEQGVGVWVGAERCCDPVVSPDFATAPRVGTRQQVASFCTRGRGRAVPAPPRHPENPGLGV